MVALAVSNRAGRSVPMKRLLFVAVLALSFSIAAIAPAATRYFSGSVEEGGLMTFKLKTEDGHKFVKGFQWGKGVPATCDVGGDTTLNGASGATMRVRHGEFGTTDDIGYAIQKVAGEFKSRHKAKGTLRVRGDFVEHEGCDTGRLHWTATDQVNR
jgi:hypothetical protein